MKQPAAAGGQLRPSLPNGPSAEPPHHPAGLPHSSPLNHTAGRPPRFTLPATTGPCSSSAVVPGHTDAVSLGNNHTVGLGGGGTSNGKVPYPQQNSLPHNCTAASHPSTSSTIGSPSQADEPWRSQQRNTTTQVPFQFLSSLLSVGQGVAIISFYVPLILFCSIF